jgi:uncharacterized protein (DUF305 family)
MKIMLPLFAAVALVTVIAGCGGDDSNAGTPTDAAFVADMTAHHAGAIDMGMTPNAMGMDTDMGALERAQPFDKAFIDAMVPHHRGAVAMAKLELAKGTQGALRKMADDIIGAQTKEIAQMKQWRKDWYGSAKVPTGKSGHGSTGDMDMGG